MQIEEPSPKKTTTENSTENSVEKPMLWVHLKKKANEKKVCRPVVSKDAHPENVEHRYHM